VAAWNRVDVAWVRLFWSERYLTSTRPGQPVSQAPHRPLPPPRSRPLPGPGPRHRRGNRSDV